MKATIHVGDVLEQLRKLPDESVQCVVTSPPYWGLRDYQTAEWDGGDTNCDHKQESPRFNGPKQTIAQVSGHASNAESHDRTHCPRCGASRRDQQLGLEKTPEEYIAKMVEVFRDVRRVLRGDGTLWLNIGDSYSSQGGAITVEMRKQYIADGHGANTGNNLFIPKDKKTPPPGLKPKDLVGIPWMLAFALRADGWWLRQDIIWSKPNPMPESVTDRCTKAHEYLFLLTKSARYFYDAEAIKEPSVTGDTRRPYTSEGAWALDGRPAEQRHGGEQRNLRQSDAPLIHVNKPGRSDGGTACNGPGQEYRNKRSVWDIATQPYPEAHFATYPEALVDPCIVAGTSERGCCPRCGAPWKRVVDVNYSNPGNRTTNGPRPTENRDITAGFEQRLQRVAETTGWEPGCSCEVADPIPCVVFDPFCGSGTTGVVALRYHRDFIGIELNAEYAQMAERRIGGEMPLFANVEQA